MFVTRLRPFNKIPFGRWEVVPENNRPISQRKNGSFFSKNLVGHSNSNLNSLIEIILTILIKGKTDRKWIKYIIFTA